MKMRYRFLKNRNKNTVGIAYNGYEEYPLNKDITCFVYGKMESTHIFNKPIDTVSFEDIIQFGLDSSHYWDELLELEISENCESPFDLVEEQWKIETLKTPHRKTA
jgi:hypothetical protein